MSDWYCECEHADHEHDHQTGECAVMGTGRACICDNPWTQRAADPDAAPELTDEWFARARLVVRHEFAPFPLPDADLCRLCGLRQSVHPGPATP